jgi:N-acetylmuramoyl-L-alanine amidase
VPGRVAWLVAPLLLVWAVAFTASAQLQLEVNGTPVAGATTSLVPGVTYAPAAGLASALGAGLDVDPTNQTVTFTLGARLLRVHVVDDPDRAGLVPSPVTLSGRPVDGPAAVFVGVEPFVPVKTVGEALGAAVSFLGQRNTVAVVSPRASVTARVEGSGAGERLVVRASAPTRVTSYYNVPVRTLQLRFERADLAAALAFEGDGFVRADVLSALGAVDVRVQLAPDTEYDLAELPDGEGFAVVIGFRSAPGGAQPQQPESPDPGVRIVIDPAHGGQDRGMAFGADDEAQLTLALAQALEGTLARAGYEVTLTRRGEVGLSVEDRATAGVGAQLFVSLHAADLPRGRVRVYYLGDAIDQAALDDAIRYNAETSLRRSETDGARRMVLLDLVVDLDAGRRYADALARELFQAGGYQVEPPRPAPLAVLTGAAGRGLLIEVGPDDLRDPSFAPILAATLATVVGRGGLPP